MNKNLNELLELKDYVNYLIEMVLSERKDDSQAEPAPQAEPVPLNYNNRRSIERKQPTYKYQNKDEYYTGRDAPDAQPVPVKKTIPKNYGLPNYSEKPKIIPDIIGPVPLRNIDQRKDVTPEYVRDAAALLSQKAKANTKVSSDNEYSKIAEKRVAELDRLKAYQNSPQRFIDDAKRNPGKTAAAGAAGVAGLGLAGYAAYKLAKKRKLEKEKAKNKG